MGIRESVRARIRALLRSRSADESLAEEIRFHLELETEKNIRLGMSTADARRVATAHFGGVQRVREEHRDVRRLQWIEDFAADARFALRSLRRSPGLAGAAITTLGLGVGANVAIFSAANAALFRSPPFPAADRLVAITETRSDRPEPSPSTEEASPANYLDWRAGAPAFEDIMATVNGLSQDVVAGRGEPRLSTTSSVTGNFFRVLGVPAVAGRVFRDDDMRASAPRAAILADRAWRDQFGADSSVVGAMITVDGAPAQVVGIAPPDFSYLGEKVDLWVCMKFDATQWTATEFRARHYLHVVGRLKPGATIEQADAQLQIVAERLRRAYPDMNGHLGVSVQPLHRFLTREARLPLRVLLTSVAVLLLIACANVANLLAVQALGRRRETSLRLALGAGHARIVRQAIAEGVVLSALGITVGLAAGWAATRALVRLQPARLLPVSDFGVDAAVVGYAAAIGVVASIFFGTAAALRTMRHDPAEVLKDGGSASGRGRRHHRSTSMLVAAEIGLAVLMSVGAGLLVQTLRHMERVDPGFDPRGVLVTKYVLDRRYNVDAKVDAFNQQLLSRAGGIPGVTTAALTNAVSLLGRGWSSGYTSDNGAASASDDEIAHRVVSPEYFAAMGVSLLRGRTLTEDDRRETSSLVINDVVARSLFPGQNPVGRQIGFAEPERGPGTTWYTVVGVVRAERVDALDVAPRREVYHAAAEFPAQISYLVLKTPGDPAALTPAVRAIVHDLDPNLVLRSARSMESIRMTSMARQRFLMTLLLLFAVVGVALSVVGVYGVFTHAARDRTREIGVRLALGARPSDVQWLVVRHGLRVVLGGLVVGVVAALAAAGSMRSLLYGVAPDDPVTLGVVALLLAGTALVASWLPAVKASRADPADTLRWG